MNAAILFLVAATGMRPGGDMRDTAMRVPAAGGAAAPAPTVTIDAMPFERTVVCMDGAGYGLLGTATDVTSVAWAASPSGESGACTGTTSWDCEIVVAPDAVGEGVETITITATGAGGTGTDTVTIGFYVDGAHSCFLSQNIDGNYNFTLVDTDPVASWYNVGSSGLDVTQATGTAQPTYRTAIVGGQPVVDFDGGDGLFAATAADWTFLHNGTTWDAEVIAKRDDTTTRVIFSNNPSADSCSASANPGICVRFESTNRLRTLQTNGVTFAAAQTSATMTTATFNLLRAGITSADVFAAVNANAATTATKIAAPSLVASGVLGVGAHPGLTGTALLNGPVFRVLIYQIALTSTQRDINKAVDEWALGGTLPVTP